MICIYNNFTFSDLGEIIITQRREMEGGEAPQRAKVTLLVKVLLYERCYADNYALLRLAQAAFSVPNALLVWQNEDSGETYLNQTATLTHEDFPEEWGTYTQEINLTFECYENLDTAAQNLPLTFLPTGGNQPFVFDHVTGWQDGLSVERFTQLRKQRRETRGKVEVRGTILADPLATLDDRRTKLAAQVNQLRAAMNSAEGQLTYGAAGQQMFNQAVRVVDFKADVDQAVTAIKFSLTAVYTLFPAESNYATCEATAEEKNNFSGETTLNCTGKITATSEAVARTKLAAVLASFLAGYGYTKGSQQQELNVTPNLISANADGDTFTELAFTGVWRKWDATNQAATFKATGKSAAVPFGNVRMWEDGYKAERFDVMRSERRHATGTISASGTYCGDATLALPDRRRALLAMQRRMKQECNSADGTLVFGDWSQIVRMEEFIAHVNQAETGIDWAFTASYSLFPNEGGYATADFTADVRDDTETGDRTLTFAGEILAPNGALARAKLSSLRAATLGIYGFTPGQQLRAQASAHDVSANGDATATVAEGMETEADVAGVTFLKLTFSEEYRQRMPGTVLNSNYTVSSRDDTTTGLLLTTYAGTVTATGASADAATAAAIVRAMAIGANKEASIDAGAFLKAQTLTIERRQTSASVPEEFVRLSFDYSYQSKLGAGRAYLEVNTQVVQDAFGPDAETVSGFVVARDFTTATAIYRQQARTPYATRLIRQETLTQSTVQAETRSALAPPADTLAFNLQAIRLEFSFTAHRDKPAGRVTARYAISVQRDFRNLKRTCRLRGSVYATNRAAADTFLNVLTAQFGQLMDSTREEDHDYTPEADVFTKLDFDDAYEDCLSGVSGVIEMRVSVAVTYSGTRWAVQPIPFQTNGGGGVSIPQAAGLTEGSRVVRGSVTAATQATAMAWAYRHRNLLTGDADNNFFPQPEQIETEYEFAPRTDGIAQNGLAGSGSVANVQLYRVGFTFAEILPNYRPPS